MFISGKRMVSADNSKHSYKDNDNIELYVQCNNAWLSDV